MDGLAAEERSAEIRGVSVRYLVAGPEDGQPVVLLHGGGMDAAAVSWRETVPRLADECRVYALDLPGYGESGPVPASVTPHVDYYVEVLSAFLAAAEITDATLVGLSKGGAVALGTTLASAARVSGLVLVASYGLGPSVPAGLPGLLYVRTPLALSASWWLLGQSRTATRIALEWVTHDAVDPGLLEDAWREVRRPNAGDGFRRFQRAEIRPSGPRTNYRSDLESLSVPTLFVHGEADPLVPPSHSETAAEAVPHAECFALPACGHWVPRERPDAFHERLEAWLRRRRR